MSSYDSNSFFRPCSTMRANEFLSSMVITSLIGAIPIIGSDLIFLL